MNDQFIQDINQNIGIAHKISRIYFTDPEDRDDVVQEMMYQLWRSYKSFDHRSKFSTWMYSVCLNTALTFKRKSRTRQNEKISLHHHDIPESDSDKKDESIEMLYKAMGVLTPLNKAIVLLYLEDLSYEEIASMTGLTKSNVSVKLVRIKRELEAELKKLNR